MEFLSSIANALILNARRLLKFSPREITADEQPPPLIKPLPLPRRLTRSYDLLSLGGVGWVYKIDNRIALKYRRDPKCGQFEKEAAFFDILEKREPCPNILRSFLRVPDGNFLAFMGGGSLHQRLEGHQKWTDDHKRIIEITGREPEALIKRWLVELCNGVAWLETLGYAHCDIRPPNLLLDSQEHLKLADFDCATPVGMEIGGSFPWARDQGAEAGDEEGAIGACGPRTEQHEGMNPMILDDFEDVTEPVELVQRMKFAPLGDDHFDTIIEKCWRGHFAQLGDLSKEVKSLFYENNLQRPPALASEDYTDIWPECQRLVDSGLLIFD